MTKAKLKLVSPTKVKRTVTPTRRPNAEIRPREHAASVPRASLDRAVLGRAVTCFCGKPAGGPRRPPPALRSGRAISQLSRIDLIDDAEKHRTALVDVAEVRQLGSDVTQRALVPLR